ncbi:MAG TPA: pyridoxamine 5'-phosphate oxidase family protein [Bacteroidales bacterium]|nr:pyridoxamine 5'-phosphate oxidase family protein [Bacteroidales bacterium]
MVDSRIIKFFRKHHVLTIATSSGNEPWCANCFYVYMEEENSLVFTTDSDTRHGMEFLQNPLVAGSVVLETMIIGKIRGIQFQGIVSEPQDDLLRKAKSAYLKRFPVAALMDTRLWVVKLTFIKMTDNRLGFGKKLIWKNLNTENSEENHKVHKEE